MNRSVNFGLWPNGKKSNQRPVICVLNDRTNTVGDAGSSPAVACDPRGVKHGNSVLLHPQREEVLQGDPPRRGDFLRDEGREPALHQDPQREGPEDSGLPFRPFRYRKKTPRPESRRCAPRPVDLTLLERFSMVRVFPYSNIRVRIGHKVNHKMNFTFYVIKL